MFLKLCALRFIVLSGFFYHFSFAILFYLNYLFFFLFSSFLRQLKFRFLEFDRFTEGRRLTRVHTRALHHCRRTISLVRLTSSDSEAAIRVGYISDGTRADLTI